MRPKRSQDLQDESVGSFLRRRLGTSDLGDNVFSAMLHGIYAGDIEQLSAKSLMTRLWDWESEHGSIIAALSTNFGPSGKPQILDRDQQVQKAMQQSSLEWTKKMSLIDGMDFNTISRWYRAKRAVHYSFKGGLGRLSAALVDYVRENGVEIKTGHEIDQLEYNKENKTVLVSFISITPAI